MNRAAEQGPVTITDHGRPSHVLLTAKEFDRLADRNRWATASGKIRIHASGSSCPSVAAFRCCRRSHRS